ncbi:MAG: phosphoribosylformylglycinamidine synthase [Bdellovibrionota bacterium]
MKTTFFKNSHVVVAVVSEDTLSAKDVEKLEWLCEAKVLKQSELGGRYVGPRKEMISPWSTNATSIATNVGISGIARMECFTDADTEIDPMLQAYYDGLNQESLRITAQPAPVQYIDDIAEYNEKEGLALSRHEISYLKKVAEDLGRKLTDCELYGFAQINSEHCRHKIFNGCFIIDNEEKGKSLFALIKDTSKAAGKYLVSAYKDNVAFISGPQIEQFHPDKNNVFILTPLESVLALKAETHNFPTTVEPFYGASTGSGGEIRDRMAGGRGSLPLIGSAIYMTAYPRLEGSEAGAYESYTTPRKWKYQTPQQILTKASNGASDFGNKFGQPLIVGSLLTFESDTEVGFYGFDRTVMLAGGVGYSKAEYALKDQPQVGDIVIVLGGDNYRIGMAGGSVSSVDTGAYSRELELSAVQRANPEMQKRVYNVIRSLVESTDNPIRMVHDHGAGGHINCLGELIDPEGGEIALKALPIGDPTLSVKEIVCNESQERMGLLAAPKDIQRIKDLSERERAPFYAVGKITGKKTFVFKDEKDETPVNLPLSALFDESPKVIMRDKTVPRTFSALDITIKNGVDFRKALDLVLSLEGVACKDWLTNKVDRSVTGLIAQQQCVGALQLPLADFGMVALDYTAKSGIALALGHAPVAGIIDAKAGSVLSVAEALTNLVWAPLAHGLEGVVLSANWMWPAKQVGEDARLYEAVQALSEFCIELGIPVPTGKDSLSMTMKYEDGLVVKAPGTVAISAMAECEDLRKGVTPDLKGVEGSVLIYVDLSGIDDAPLGGSSFAQTLGKIGDKAPTVVSVEKFKAGFSYIQELIKNEKVLAGHDVSAGGLLVAACEMAFTGDLGFKLVLNGSAEEIVKEAFSEKPAVIMQIGKESAAEVLARFSALGIAAKSLAIVGGDEISVEADKLSFDVSVDSLRRVWFAPSALLEQYQTRKDKAEERYKTCGTTPLHYEFPNKFSGKAADYGVDLSRMSTGQLKAAIIREEGTNGDREMAFSMHAAGFCVKDIMMTDLLSGREDLSDLSFIVFPGGFTNSDVLGAGRGWAGAFKFNDRAAEALQRFYQRENTLSLGVCNGCQLMVALGVLYPEHKKQPEMKHNDSQKFETGFVNVVVEESNSVLLAGLQGARLGVWVAHGEGKFYLPEEESAYNIPLKYAYSEYPANPNGAGFRAAGICSLDGRHLAMMPHLERSILPWQWPYLTKNDWEITPWMLAFVNARNWLQTR